MEQMLQYRTALEFYKKGLTLINSDNNNEDIMDRDVKLRLIKKISEIENN